MLDMSRCVVGSSISSRLGGSSKSFTRASRLFSPPLSTLTFLKTSSPLKRKQPRSVRTNCSVTRCGVAEAAGAALGCQHAAKYLQQRGFTGPVRADQHDPLAALGLKIEAAIDHVFAIGVMDGFEPDHLQAAALWLGELEINFALLPRRR